MRYIIYVVLLFLLIGGASLIIPPAQAQPPPPDDPQCPALIEEALAAVEQNCLNTGRNTVCYGNNLVQASFNQEVPPDVFDAPADTVELNTVRNLVTSPLNIPQNLWGVALLNVQANIAGTSPGQTTRFILLGDAQVENRVDPAQIFIPESTLGVRVTAGVDVNIRTGPGTDYNVLGSVPSGTTFDAEALNTEADWVRVIYNNAPGWILRDLVGTISGESLDELPQIDIGAVAPMQAFYFTTGVGLPQCQQAPSSLIVQTPRTVEVAFTVNGTEIRVGSTVVLQTVESDFTPAQPAAESESAGPVDGVAITEPFYLFPANDNVLVLAGAGPLSGGIPLTDAAYVRALADQTSVITTSFDATTGIASSGGVYVNPASGTILPNVSPPFPLEGIALDGAVRLRPGPAGSILFDADPATDQAPRGLRLEANGIIQTYDLSPDFPSVAANPIFDAARAGALKAGETESTPTAEPTPAPDTGRSAGCATTELIVLDGEAQVNDGAVDVVLGHSAQLETCFDETGEIVQSGQWQDTGRVSQDRLAEFAVLEDFDPGLLNYRIDLPSDGEIDFVVNPPTAVPQATQPAGETVTPTPTPTAMTTGTPFPTNPPLNPGTPDPMPGVDCSNFFGIAPVSMVPPGNVTFSWEAAPGADAYFFVLESNGETVLVREVRSTFTSVNLSDPMLGGPDFIWFVEAVVGRMDDVACITPAITITRN